LDTADAARALAEGAARAAQAQGALPDGVRRARHDRRCERGGRRKDQGPPRTPLADRCRQCRFHQGLDERGGQEEALRVRRRIQSDAVRGRRRPAPRRYARRAESTSSAWPSGFTKYHDFSTRPSEPIRKVERITPSPRPGRSPHAPYAWWAVRSGSLSRRTRSPYFLRKA